jgi:glutamine---fructose-6-phosphate transaminase (isomerizing)
MCGIVAYSGKKESSLNTLLLGLKRLEYRGYDSAGIAINMGNKVVSEKSVGRVVELEKKTIKSKDEFAGRVGIAHTRWATHGEASLVNAHPHTDTKHQFWVVHNGIIENYIELKEMLLQENIQLKSDTDTEVIAALIAHFYKSNLREAVLEAISKLEGAYAFCVISALEPDRLVCAKFASPLVVGLGENEFVIASDVSAIVEKTREVIYLEDNELIDINIGEYEIVNFQNTQIRKKIHLIDWDIEEATKGGYEHYLLKEILEQPQVTQDSIRGRLLRTEGSVKFGGLLDVEKKIRNCDQIILLGAGTSFYSAKMGELYFNELTARPARAIMSPEFRYGKYNLGKRTWAIALSQSGETADTIAATQEATRQGALSTGIVNVVGSTIARITKAGVYNHIGTEISVASTKAFTSQSLLLLMHAVLLGRSEGLSVDVAKNIIDAIENLPKNIQKVLDSREEIELVAQQVAKSNNIFYLGRQYNYPIALEGALKLKEISYIHAEGLSGGELKHGFIALVEPANLTIAIATEGTVFDKILANVAEVKARKGKVIAVANSSLVDVDATIVVPQSTHEMLQPIINNVALQLLAYYVAKEKKLPIDQPRNLAKSVTVE